MCGGALMGNGDVKCRQRIVNKIKIVSTDTVGETRRRRDADLRRVVEAKGHKGHGGHVGYGEGSR